MFSESAFNPSKCTHLEQWAADCAAPGEQSWTSCRSRDSNPLPRVSSPTLYPLGQRLPILGNLFYFTSSCIPCIQALFVLLLFVLFVIHLVPWRLMIVSFFVCFLHLNILQVCNFILGL